MFLKALHLRAYKIALKQVLTGANVTNVLSSCQAFSTLSVFATVFKLSFITEEIFNAKFDERECRGEDV